MLILKLEGLKQDNMSDKNNIETNEGMIMRILYVGVHTFYYETCACYFSQSSACKFLIKTDTSK